MIKWKVNILVLEYMRKEEEKKDEREKRECLMTLRKSINTHIYIYTHKHTYTLPSCPT